MHSGGHTPRMSPPSPSQKLAADELPAPRGLSALRAVPCSQAPARGLPHGSAQDELTCSSRVLGGRRQRTQSRPHGRTPRRQPPRSSNLGLITTRSDARCSVRPFLRWAALTGEDNFTYCPATGLAEGSERSPFAGWAFPFPGVFLAEEFVSEEEEVEMVGLMDRDEWKPSQSGRKKQDYGPKVNFKKQRLKAGGFTGLPSFSKKIVAQMEACSVLGGFLPVEQCNLDYRPERGSAIDPHFDDWWLWGERLVSLNLLSKTVLSMSCDSEDSIQLFPTFSNENRELNPPGSLTQMSACENLGKQGSSCLLSPRLVPSKEVTVAIHLPRRSLVVLYDEARYKWKHAIHRRHIEHRRVCVTFRELSAEFSAGGRREELGKELLEIALSFQGTPV